MQNKDEWSSSLIEQFVDNLANSVNRQLETRQPSSQQEITDFLIYTKTIRLGAVLLPSSMEQLIGKIFHSEIITSFLEDVYFDMFCLHWPTPRQYEQLCQAVTDGLSMDGQDDDYCLLPAEVKVTHQRNIFSQISSWENKLLSLFGFRQKGASLSLFLTIKNNPWLIIVLMFRCIVVDTSEKDL